MKPHELKTPDEMTEEFAISVNVGDMRLAVDSMWDIIEDVIDSAGLATYNILRKSSDLSFSQIDAIVDEVVGTLKDYTSNHYGEENFGV